MRVQIFLALFGLVLPAVMSAGELHPASTLQGQNAYSATIVAYRGSGRLSQWMK